MKVTYFSDTDTALIEFSSKEVKETKEIAENMYIDVDENGSIVNVTIEHANKNASLPGFSYNEISHSA